MGNEYISKAEVVRLVREAQETGVINDEIAKAFLLISSNMWLKYGYTRHHEDSQDAIHGAAEHMLTQIHMLDCSKNVFCYISQGCKYFFFQKSRQHTSNAEKWCRLLEREQTVNRAKWKHELR